MSRNFYSNKNVQKKKHFKARATYEVKLPTLAHLPQSRKIKGLESMLSHTVSQARSH
jgi:hypothetical protein